MGLYAKFQRKNSSIEASFCRTYNIEEILSRFFCLSPEGVETYVEFGDKRRKVPKFTDINLRNLLYKLPPSVRANLQWAPVVP